jgi:preprotein translocase subunit SecG
MSVFLIIIHIFVCVALIMIVLLQTGKGADMGAAFGGGSSQTLFGSTGASTFLSKLTTVAAVVFMLTSLALAYRSGHRQEGSIMPDVRPPVEQPAQTEAPAKEATETETAGSKETAPATESKAAEETPPKAAEPGTPKTAESQKQPGTEKAK